MDLICCISATFLLPLFILKLCSQIVYCYPVPGNLLLVGSDL